MSSIAITQLDNIFPPTWDGTLPYGDGEEYVDANSALRYTQGHDWINYHMLQRVQGDLFLRDLLLESMIGRYNDFLETRTGICYNTPKIIVPANSYIQVGRVSVGSNLAKAWIVYAAVAAINLNGAANTDIVLSVYATDGSGVITGSPIASVNGATAANSNWMVAAAETYEERVTDRGPEMATGTTFEYRLVNNHATLDVTCSAAVVWFPVAPSP